MPAGGVTAIMITGAKYKSIAAWLLTVCLLLGSPTRSLLAAQDHWPTAGWRSSTPEAQGVDSQTLIEMLETVRDRAYAIDSITIVRNGTLVVDAYLHPFRQGTKHIIESATKSITSAVVGIAIDKGYIKGVDQSLADLLPEHSGIALADGKRDITLAHLLTMTSGLDTRDSYVYRHAGFHEMLASGDWVRHILGRPLARPPGEAFEYSNGGAHLVSAIIQQAAETSTLALAKAHLFAPLGITDVSWASDPQGVTIGEGQIMMTPRDLAKIGLLYLNRGRWEDRQIIPMAWVEASTRQQVAAEPFDGYGYLWWTDASGYAIAAGYLGQYLFVVPHKSLVVVITGHLRGGTSFVPKQLLDQFIIPAARAPGPLPAKPEQNARLNALIASFAEAPPEGFTWSPEPQGAAKDGTYVHRAPVAFRFTYPKTSFKRRTLPHEVMAMQTQAEGAFAAAVADIPEGVGLPEVGPKTFADRLRDLGWTVELLTNAAITLADGTAAYRTDFTWRRERAFAVRSLLVSAFVDGKWVALTYATPLDYHEATLSENLAEGRSIVESLRFD